MAHMLTRPLRGYEQRIPNNLSALKSTLRKGDVFLVEGDQRVSQVIRYLTQSSWSHCAMYIGDELWRYQPAIADRLLAEHGEEARHMVIEALDGTGVVCSPIAKYARHNVRVCRPRGLRREDLDRLIDELVRQLGRPYSVRHIVSLARYFFPVSLIPRRFRRAALHYKSDANQTLVCSTMLARAFAHVGYPVLPRVTIGDSPLPATWFHRLIGRNGNGTRALYEEQNPALITPRDFDLSPYFEIVKFNHLANGKFDYRRIEWASANGNGNGNGSRNGHDGDHPVRHAHIVRAG
jgi:permuted papain-like amidase YaeF/Yiix C92 family enzyme